MALKVIFVDEFLWPPVIHLGSSAHILYNSTLSDSDDICHACASILTIVQTYEYKRVILILNFDVAFNTGTYIRCNVIHLCRPTNYNVSQKVSVFLRSSYCGLSCFSYHTIEHVICCIHSITNVTYFKV